MKRVIAIIAVTALVMFLFACGSSEQKSEEKVEDATPEVTEVKKDEVAKPETAEVKEAVEKVEDATPEVTEVKKDEVAKPETAEVKEGEKSESEKPAEEQK
jgi:thiamine biosynthesis lipoprotein ApbE